MCNITANQIKEDGQAVANAVLAIAKIEAPINPELAANLTTAANGLIAVTSTWTQGSSVAIFNDAATVLEVALGAIPETAAIAPLIPIAVAAIDLLIANIGNPSPAITPDAVKVTMFRVEQHAAINPNPYRGKAVIPHSHWRSMKDDFISAWDKTADEHPELASAKLAA